ncbi:MAG: hypothetical protein GX235_10815 [Clostridiales bacterium]|nr:hypothetical protein [Clostridiales bacterium]
MGKNIPGVYAARKKDNSIYYRASITFREKHISLGSYELAETAHLAYKEAQLLTKSNFIFVEDYTSASLLPFEKWVCLLNYRDNGLYFATPIYMKKKYFLYYLSPSYILKFDIDDLFYYSSRKIMRRGGHLFVADYGMQVNILNRYGIKNYAVEGKDYRFINGDFTDFRYENIEIINRFHGIIHIPSPKGTKYKVRIHVRSNYVVGVYNTEEEAAIAYNKAVDVLKRNGIDRNYSLNYIEGLSPAAYADIYSKLKISPKISKLTPNNS